MVQGPRDISIYMEQCEGSLATFSEEVCVVARKAQREIIDLLSRVSQTDICQWKLAEENI